MTNTKFGNKPTDPTKADTDKDGVNDGDEIKGGTDPNTPNSNVDPGTKTDEVKEGTPTKLDETVKNPTKDTSGQVVDENGKVIDGSKVTIDPNTGEITVTVPDGYTQDGQDRPATVVISDGTKVEITVTPTSGTDNGNSSDASSKLNPKCVPAGLAAGLPLLLLIPVGIMSQVNIPGLEPLKAQISNQIGSINQQIEAANSGLQKQLGIFNGPAAQQMAQINAQFQKYGVNAGQVVGGVALAAAGLAALAWVISSCLPANNNDKSSLDSSGK